MVEPSKVVSDQYQVTKFLMEDGRVITGRVANLDGDTLMVVTNMLAPGDFTNLNRDEIEWMSPVKTSEMPAGLLNTFSEDEIRDLLAYLISGGNAEAPVFRDSRN